MNRLGLSEKEIEDINIFVSEIKILHTNLFKQIEQIQNDYFSIRKKDLNKQLIIVEEDINFIKSTYESYNSDIQFLDKKEINSISFKLKSIFFV